ncbi:MAG: Ger(x)C family spore germination protein [Clostridiales bacterium]|jgi:spore germination protein KC|nr:Ger(x)C family spore germination protein [Clostridiales bacterium]
MKKFVALIGAIVFLFILTGCWDSVEPKDLAIITSFMIDADEDGGYEIFMEVLRPESTTADEDGGSQGSLHYSGTGPTFTDALYNSAATINNKLFAGANKIRVFSERFVKKGMRDPLDYFLRDQLTDEGPLMIMYTGGEIGDLFFADTRMSDTLGRYVDSVADSQLSVSSSGVYSRTLDFAKDVLEDGKQPVMGLISLKTNAVKGKGEKSAQVVYEGLAAFKGTELAGTMNAEETRAYNILTNGARGVEETVRTDAGDVMAINARDIKTKIRAGMDGANRVSVNIDVKIGGHLVLFASDTLKSSNKDDRAIAENLFAERFASQIAAAVKKAQTEFKSDIFGFGKHFYKRNFSRWEQIADAWDDEYFANAAVSVKVECKLNDSGQIRDEYKPEKI